MSSHRSRQFAPRAFPGTPPGPISIDGPSDSRETQHLDTPNVPHVHHVSSFDKRRMTINILPDDVLLIIFHFDVLEDISPVLCLPWHRLVHVCQRWRSLTFASPNFLHLRLICSPWTRVKFTSIWPPLPIIIKDMDDWPMPHNYDFNAAIVHPNRVSEIDLRLTSSQLQRLASAMQEQFPALIHLKVGFDIDGYLTPIPTLPDGFLAPNLQSLELHSVPFPTLPKFLLSATGLIRLTLSNIDRHSYISPETIVTGLAMMANLKSLTIEFVPFIFLPDQKTRTPLPLTRTILPALTCLRFQGISEYLEDVVSRIDAPMLDTTCITFYQLVFDITQLTQLIKHTTRFEVLSEAHVDLDFNGIIVGNLPPTRNVDEMSGFRISVLHVDMNRWHSSLAQFFTSIFPFIFMVKHIYIYARYISSDWRVNSENIQCLEIFHRFTALKNLYLSKVLALRIAPALQKLVGGRVTEVLPTLQNLYLEGLEPSGHIQEAIGKFMSARQLSGHPMTVSLWVRDSERDSERDAERDPDSDLDWDSDFRPDPASDSDSYRW